MADPIDVVVDTLIFIKANYCVSHKALEIEIERILMIRILNMYQWNIVKAARFMQVDRKNFYRRMREHGLMRIKKGLVS